MDRIQKTRSVFPATFVFETYQHIPGTRSCRHVVRMLEPAMLNANEHHLFQQLATHKHWEEVCGFSYLHIIAYLGIVDTSVCTHDPHYKQEIKRVQEKMASQGIRQFLLLLAPSAPENVKNSFPAVFDYPLCWRVNQTQINETE
jgi:hypothetical protein